MKVMRLFLLLLLVSAASTAWGQLGHVADSIARLQEEMKAKEQERLAHHLSGFKGDTARWERDRVRMKTWRRRVFVGSDVGLNFCVADNITDHPPFKWGDAWGTGVEAQAGVIFNRKVGLRTGFGLHRAANRWGRENINTWQFQHVYSGNGFFTFSVTEAYLDVLFDVSGLASVDVFRPVHVYTAVGLSMLHTGDKEMDARAHGFPLVEGSDGRKYYDVDVKDAEGNTMKLPNGKPMHAPYYGFGSTVDTDPQTMLGVRMSVLVDWRFSRQMSAGLEVGATVTGDRFEGIDYDEPFDIFLKAKAGVKWWF